MVKQPFASAPGPSPRTIAVWTVLTTALYYASEWAAMQITLPGTYTAVVWPANGLAIAIGVFVSPWVGIGAGLGDLLYGTIQVSAPGAALGSGIGNALEVIAISYVIRRWCNGADAFHTPAGVLRYAALAGVALPVISASIGATAWTAAGLMPWSDYATSWLTWYLSDVVAILLLTPAILVWRARRGSIERRAEALYFSLTLAGAAALVAIMPLDGRQFGFAILALPLVFWSAFRLDARFVTLTTLVLGLATVLPLAFGLVDENTSLLFQASQVFIAAAAVTGLLVRSTVERETMRLHEAARREFETVNAARDRLLSSFAHELNNPLTPMLLELDLMRAGPMDEHDRARSFGVLDRSTHRLSRLVADLRDVSNLQANHPLRIRRTTSDLATLAHEALDSYASSAAASGVRLTYVGPASAPVQADPGRIAQVLANLLTNAIKYSPRGSVVAIEVDQTRHATNVRVRDQGTGIAPEALMNAFTPFAQLQHGAAQREGTGLGLYITKGIVEAHGGRIRAQSPGLGRGSTFSFSIPHDEATAASGTPPPHAVGGVPS